MKVTSKPFKQRISAQATLEWSNLSCCIECRLIRGKKVSNVASLIEKKKAKRKIPSSIKVVAKV